MYFRYVKEIMGFNLITMCFCVVFSDKSFSKLEHSGGGRFHHVTGMNRSLIMDYLLNSLKYNTFYNNEKRAKGTNIFMHDVQEFVDKLQSFINKKKVKKYKEKPTSASGDMLNEGLINSYLNNTPNQKHRKKGVLLKKSVFKLKVYPAQASIITRLIHNQKQTMRGSKVGVNMNHCIDQRTQTLMEHGSTATSPITNLNTSTIKSDEVPETNWNSLHVFNVYLPSTELSFGRNKTNDTISDTSVTNFAERKKTHEDQQKILKGYKIEGVEIEHRNYSIGDNAIVTPYSTTNYSAGITTNSSLTCTEPSYLRNDKVLFFEKYDTATFSNNQSANLDHHVEDYANFNEFTRYTPRKLQKEITSTTIKAYSNHAANTMPICSTASQIEPNMSYNNSMNQPDMNFTSSPASWVDFPFVAIFLHKETKTRCDAAGLSSHWLVTAGSCLYYRHKEALLVDRPAFIFYCGDDWKNLRKITFVKSSFVHPKYHPIREPRRHFYNIGLIQVQDSMAATCPGWAPVSIIPQLFVANPTGSLVSAVGWGFDQYKDYKIKPNWDFKLMHYHGKVYSLKCPGNFRYSKLILSMSNEQQKRIYCLSLPPDHGDENHHIHGSLLLFNKQLIGLYLEEERRPYGNQSAQYTSIWHLMSWISENVQESKSEHYSFEAI